MNTALATTKTTSIDPYNPGNFSEAWRLAEIVAAARLAPGIATPEQALMILALGADLGLSSMQSIRGIHIIEGRPCPSADCLAACVLRSGLAEYFTEVETTEQLSTWETKRKNEAKPRRYTFTIEDAKRAGLTNRGKDPSQNNWNKYPKRMLSARAKAFLVRDVYPDLALGLYTPDEIAEQPIHVQSEVVASYPSSAEPDPVEPGISNEWEDRIMSAPDLQSLKDAANRAVKSGVPSDVVKPVFNARLAEIKGVDEAAQ